VRARGVLSDVTEARRKVLAETKGAIRQNEKMMEKAEAFDD
jgi:hypothetical protein